MALQFNVENTQRPFRTDGLARIVSLRFDRPSADFFVDEPLRYIVRVRAHSPLSRLRVGMTVFTVIGAPVGTSFSPELDVNDMTSGDEREFTITLPFDPPLSPGRYYCGLSIGRGDNRTRLINYDIVLDTLHFTVCEAMEYGPLDFGELSVATKE